jgi:hypothetical protein
VKSKVYGIVEMVNVFLHHTFVMDQVSGAMQAGVLIVPMVQMKTLTAVVHQVAMPMIYVTLHHTVKMKQHVTQALKVTVLTQMQDLTVMAL